MGSKNKMLKVIALQDGTSAVVKIDPAAPQLLEVVATFSDAAVQGVRAQHRRTQSVLGMINILQ